MAGGFQAPTLVSHYSPGPSRAPGGSYSVRTKLTGKTYSLGQVYLGVSGTPVMRLGRSLDGLNWVKGAYGAIYRANLAIARETQRQAVEKLKSTLVRPGQSTGNLERAISQPGAVYADGSRIIIGVGEVIDAEAKYWRAVEEGMDPLPFTAFGFWTEAGRGGSGPLGPPGGSNTGRPIILSFNSEPNAKRFFVWRFTRGIEPHQFFSDAWDDVRASGYIEEAYAEAFAGVGLDFEPTFAARMGRSSGAGDFGL